MHFDHVKGLVLFEYCMQAFKALMHEFPCPSRLFKVEDLCAYNKSPLLSYEIVAKRTKGTFCNCRYYWYVANLLH